jgi:hypothetical protein
MALSTQKGCSFYAFKLQISIFSLYVAMWVKAIFKRGNKTQRERERERERENSLVLAGQTLKVTMEEKVALILT